MAEARIVEVIKFGDTYFTYDDVVEITTAHATYVGRIKHFANNGVQSYINLDTSKTFIADDVVVDVCKVLDMKYYQVCP